MLAAPLVAEVLPGATRFSSVFVFPIEVCVWGGGALLIRDAVRRWRLGWRNMLLLALSLAVAEEFLIQQTSLAPMVLQLKGEEYARAFGINYVYLLWALVYETVFVVFLPIHLVELIFRTRREALWLSKAGVVLVGAFFLPGSYLAWYAWTQIARPKVFHVPAYHPPVDTILLAVVAVCGLVVAALGPFRNSVARSRGSLPPPPPWLLGTLAAIWAVTWYGLVLLAFGIAPAFPPLVALATGLLLAGAALVLLPRWSANRSWKTNHEFATIFGALLGSMLISFIGFIGAAPADLYFKIAADTLAISFMLVLYRNLPATSESAR